MSVIELLFNLVLVLGATMRLTRLVVTDDLGLWFVRVPAMFWTQRHHIELHPPESSSIMSSRVPAFIPTWRDKLVSGLSCVFCVGFWVGAIVLGAFLFIRPDVHDDVLSLSFWWYWVVGALTLNHVAAHLGSRLGDSGYAED